jgi:UDP-N-acetylmuramate dehydrogenase
MEDWRRDIERALAGRGATCRADELLSRHTTFGIGGIAEIWVEVMDEQTLAAAISHCRERGIRWWVLGRGSNVLVSDQGLDGVVLRLGGDLARIRVNGSQLEAGAGAGLDDLAVRAEAAGLRGAEFLAGIPGTVGGGLRTNAGAFGRSLTDVLEGVRVLETNGSSMTLKCTDFIRGYRTSVIDGSVIVTSAVLRLDPGTSTPADEIRRRRWEKQPSDFSAGSFFKNPPGEAAGRLIEWCGMKGRRVGAAQVSDKHANFIINTGGARFADVYGLAQVVKANVEAQTGILLEEEVQVLPSDRR